MALQLVISGTRPCAWWVNGGLWWRRNCSSLMTWTNVKLVEPLDPHSNLIRTFFLKGTITSRGILRMYFYSLFLLQLHIYCTFFLLIHTFGNTLPLFYFHLFPHLHFFRRLWAERFWADTETHPPVQEMCAAFTLLLLLSPPFSLSLSPCHTHTHTHTDGSRLN